MPKLKASDLHLKVGIPPTYRIGGRLKPINGAAVTDLGNGRRDGHADDERQAESRLRA
jgi:Tfp pilus assembly pilus retraction ATPase PilT